MSTMLPGGRSTFNTSGPATASAPATAIANAAAALGTTSNNGAATTATSPFAPASNLNFATSSLATPSGSAVGGGVPNPNAVQGPQYATQPGQPGYSGGMTLDNPAYPAWHQTNLDRARAEALVQQGTAVPSSSSSAMFNGSNLSEMTRTQAFQQFGLAGTQAWDNYWNAGTDWESMLQPGGQLDQSLIGSGNNPSWNIAPVVTGNPSGHETRQFTSADISPSGILTTASGNTINLASMDWNTAQHQYSQQVQSAWLLYHGGQHG